MLLRNVAKLFGAPPVPHEALLEARPIRDISVAQLRAAASAWRAYGRPGNNVYDRIDELIDEVERLRKDRA